MPYGDGQPPQSSGAEALKNEFPDLEFCFGGFDCRGLVQAEQIIISPGIPMDTPEVRAALDMGIEVIGDVELFARAIADKGPCVLAITGSNGKSTVTTLVGEMLKAGGKQAAIGGNIGCRRWSFWAKTSVTMCWSYPVSSWKPLIVSSVWRQLA